MCPQPHVWACLFQLPLKTETQLLDLIHNSPPSHSEPTPSLQPLFSARADEKEKKRRRTKRSRRGPIGAARQTGQSGLHMISAATADWRAAGSKGADCNPKDVAWMVEHYVIGGGGGRKKKNKRTPRHSEPLITSIT